MSRKKKEQTKCESPNQSEKKKKELKPDRKDGVALIIALFQLLLPWVAGGVLIYFLAVFLLSRIGGA